MDGPRNHAKGNVHGSFGCVLSHNGQHVRLRPPMCSVLVKILSAQVLWELLCYHAPFYGLQSPVASAVHDAVLLNDARPGIPSHTPPSYAALLQFGWHSDPAKRPTMKQMLALLERMQAVARPTLISA